MKIVEAIPQEGYKLFLRFENDLTGEVDLSELAGRGVFSQWQQPGVFQKVKVTDVGAVEWPGELDLCPDALYMQVTGKTPDEVLDNLQHLSDHA